MMIRLVLYERQELIRACLTNLFKGDPEIELVGETGCDKILLDYISSLEIDLILLGVNQIMEEELVLIRRVSDHSKSRILLFSEESNADRIAYAFEYGELL